jgi:nucleoside-diphosphate-sugar epimerase
VGSWDGVEVLVTGAGGFIGGHLTAALNRAGARVRALCRYTSRADRGTLEWFVPTDLDGVEIVFGDLRDSDAVTRAVAGVDTIFHLGAQIAIPYSLQNPRDVFATNVGGTLNVAQAALAGGVRRLIHVSTSEVYGAARTLPLNESHPPAPRSPYAASKAAADLLVQSFHHAYGLGVVTARPFNTYGPHQSARAIVPAIIVQALAGGPVALGRLDPRRDLSFVSDTVAGLMALGGGDERLLGRTLQLGSGSDVSVAELVTLIEALLGRDLEVRLDPARVRPAGSELPRLLSDHSRMTEMTGWTPQVSLADGLGRTLAWLRDNAGHYRPAEYLR